MATALGFSVWRDEDGFYAPGQTAELYDGELVTLVNSLKNYLEQSGKEMSELDFKTTLEQNGSELAEHSFKFDKKSSMWFIVDPADSDEDGSFTSAFVNVFANCVAGDHEYTVNFFINNELYSQGQLVYKSDGVNAAYKELLQKFGDVTGAREQANQEHQQEYAQQLAEEDAQQQAEREFQVFVNNIDSGQTKHVLETNLTTRSEKIHNVSPSQILTLNLFRGSSFELKYYHQNTSKDTASFIAMVDETCNEETYTIF